MKTMASVSLPAGVGGAGEGGAEVETEYCHPHEHCHAGVVARVAKDSTGDRALGDERIENTNTFF